MSPSVKFGLKDLVGHPELRELLYGLLFWIAVVVSVVCAIIYWAFRIFSVQFV
jgi:hypothetical protein